MAMEYKQREVLPVKIIKWTIPGSGVASPGAALPNGNAVNFFLLRREKKKEE